jgi:hypothetical protein
MMLYRVGAEPSAHLATRCAWPNDLRWRAPAASEERHVRASANRAACVAAYKSTVGPGAGVEPADSGGQFAASGDLVRDLYRPRRWRSRSRRHHSFQWMCPGTASARPEGNAGFDDFAWRLGLPLGPGELYRRYAEMITSEPAEDGAAGFMPYRTSWLAAGRRLLAPFGREPAAGQFADAYADMHATAVIFPDVPDALQALARHFRIGVIANADHDDLRRCLDRNGLRFDVLVDSETASCYEPEPRSSASRARRCRCPRTRR